MLYDKPTFAYINALYEETLRETSTQTRVTMDTESREIYLDTSLVQFPENIKEPVKIALRMTFDVVQRLKGILSKEPFLKVVDIGLTEVAQKLTSTLEKGINALFEQLEKESPYSNVFDKVREDQIIYGRAYTSLMYSPDQWATYNAWVKEALPELQKEAQKLENTEDVLKALKKLNNDKTIETKSLSLLPLALRHKPAVNMYPISGTNGPSEYIYLGKKRVKDILEGLEDGTFESAPMLLERYNNQNDDAARARLLMTEVEYLEYYSSTYFAYILRGSIFGRGNKGELIRCEEHKYRMNPIIEWLGDSTSDIEHPYISMIYSIVGIARGMNDLMSQMMTNVRHWVWTTLFLKSDIMSPGEDTRQEAFPIAYGQINPLYKGEELESLSRLIGPLNVEIPTLWNFLRGLFSLMTLSPVLSGIAEGDVSAGYAINSLRQGALTRWGALVNNYNRSKEVLGQLALNIIKYRVGESVVIHTGLKGDSKRSVIELDPTEFPEKVFFQADYQLKLPVDLAANMQIARMGTEMRGSRPPLMPDSWARALLEDESPDQTESEIMKQEWKYTPEAWAFFTKKVLEQAGLALEPSPADQTSALLELQGMNLPESARAAMQKYAQGQSVLPNPGLGQGLANAQGAQESMGQGGRAAGQAVQPGGPQMP